MIILIYLLMGLMGGILAGMMGSGCGLIMVPALLIIFKYLQVNSLIQMHLAVGTGIAILVISGISTTTAHLKHGNHDWPLIFKVAPFCALGAITGAIIAGYLPGRVMEIIFSAVVFYFALSLFLKKFVRQKVRSASTQEIALYGFLFSTLSTITGAGLGKLFIPFLNRRGYSIFKAVPISSACSVFYTTTATVGYIISGWNNPLTPEWSFVFVYLPALLGTSLTIILGTRVGAKISKNISDKLMSLIFAFYLIVAGVVVLVS